RRHTRFSRDWSSDVCSSDLERKIREIYIVHLRPASEAGSKVDFGIRYIATDGRRGLVRLVDSTHLVHGAHLLLVQQQKGNGAFRSEERRVGKECRRRWARAD